MANLINEKLQAPVNTGVKPAYTTASEKKEEKKVVPKQDSTPSNNGLGKLVLPLSLIAGGGILLYLGLRGPKKIEIFNAHVRNKLAQMEIEINGFEQYVDKTIRTSFAEVSEYISKYKKDNDIIPTVFSSNIRRLREPKQVADAQDLAFEAIANSDGEIRRAGASDMGNFMCKVSDVKGRAVSQIDGKKEQVRLLFGDYVHLPRFKDGKYADLMETSESQLVTTAGVYLEQLERMKLAAIRKAVSDQYQDMTDFVVKIRGLRNESKAQVIENSFAQIRRLKGISDDFKPSYNKIATLDNFEKLTPEELAPQVLPSQLEEIYGNDIFIKFLKEHDFNEVTEDDLRRFFYSTPYNNTVKDLGFLVDRLRIRKVVAEPKPEEAKIYDNMIAKLEFLSNKLNVYGKDELLKKCSRDFEHMNVDQRKAALYYVTTVSRRLGFDSVLQMDEYMVKNSPAYRELNIREYMEIFKENPELYFM